MEKNETLEHYEDLWFSVIYRVSDYSVDFECYQWMYVYEGAPHYELEYSGDGAASAVSDIDKAETYLTGMVKWDGCSHFYFGGKEKDGYIHLCGKNSVEKHRKIIETIYQKCGSLMKKSYKSEFTNLT